MNDLIQTLLEQLKKTGGGSKAVAWLVAVAMVLVIGVTAVVTNKPDYQLAFSGLSDHELAKVSKAIADEGVDFYVSQPPAPFNVYVDRGQRSSAYKAAYSSGALDKPLEGIISDQGVASVFSGSEERMQAVRKREWQEMEGMLEEHEFVLSARVRTSPGNVSPLAGLKAAPSTGSVTLHIVRSYNLTEAQAETMALLVSRGLGLAPENLVISDQLGNTLFDGSATDQDETESIKDFLTHEVEYNSRKTEEANRVLAEILGPEMARVTVHSEWDYDHSTTITETMNGRGGLLSEEKKSTETPLPQQGQGGATGVTANSADSSQLGTGSGSTTTDGAGEPLLSTTSEERKEYQPTITTEERRHFVPALKRMSISLFLSDTIEESDAIELEQAVQAAVGFDPERGDTFSSIQVPFNVEPVPEEGVEGETPEPASEPNPLVEKLIEHGLEALTGLVFIILLLKSLRGSSKNAAASQITPAKKQDEAEAIDPEALARAQIDELLHADPERVGQILSNWARAEEPVAGGKS